MVGSLGLVRQGLSLLTSLDVAGTSSGIEGIAGGGGGGGGGGVAGEGGESEGGLGLLARTRSLRTGLARSDSDALKQQVSLLCMRACDGVLQAVRMQDWASLQAAGLSQPLEGVSALRGGLSR